MNAMNIVYIHSHDTGRYIEPHGYPVSSPHLQQLAEQGVLFRQAFCAAPTCSPSRASLLTGEYAHSNGQFGLAHLGFELPDLDKHLASFLKTHGYFTALFGIQHVRKDAESIGYDYCEPGATRAKDLVPVVEDFLKNKPQQPFFLDIGFSETHREFPPVTNKAEINYCLPPAPLPDTPETRADMAAFKSSLELFDAGVGRILEALNTNGLRENTLIICTTDHGIAFPGMKCTLTDHGIGVFLIMQGPEGFQGGKVVDALVSQIDIFPTLCELLKVPAPERLQGRSLLPLIKGQQKEINEEIFAEINYHCQYEPTRAVRTKRWKYIKRFFDRETPFLANIDAGASKDLLLEHGLAKRKTAKEELYDLLFDPNEANNLIAEPSLAAVKEDMRERLNKWMHETNDPLLSGDITPPPGAVVMDPDLVDPE